SSVATLTVGANHLGAATQIVNATGSYSATGTTSGTWMATITTYGPAPEAAPHAALTVSPSSGRPPLAVTADASTSTDTDATPIASYTFDFGDGTVVGPQSGATAKHTYPGAGSFSVTVTVVDSGGFSSRATSTVAVSGTTSSSAVVVYAGYYDTHHKYNLQ